MFSRGNKTTKPLIVLFRFVCLARLPLLAISGISIDSASEWSFWKYENIKDLDPWGDSDGDARDVVAIYVKEDADNIHFRIDLLDLRSDSSQNIYFAIDYKASGDTALIKGNQDFVSDISWDLLFVIVDSSQQVVLDTAYVGHPDYLTHVAVENQLDFVEFSIRKTVFAGWDGKPFQVQAIVTRSKSTLISDKTTPVFTDATTGRAKLLLLFGNMFNANSPDGISWYDGFRLQSEDRPGERRGLKYLLDATEKYELPFTTIDLRVEMLPGTDYLRINDRLRDLASRGLLDALTTFTYSYYFPWQPDDVNLSAIESARNSRREFGIPESEVLYPYEAWLKSGDLATIKSASYTAIYALDQYYKWFGWDLDWSDSISVNRYWESPKKIHLANGIKIFFGLQAFIWDSRWDNLGIQPGWHLHARESYIGTDSGLHHGWRRVLLDLAFDPDQEKYMTIGTDIDITSWLFQDIAECNVRWLAAHPWIEVTTFSDLLKRNWTPVDHGDLGLAPDQPLEQYPKEGGASSNDYFWQNYYGSISDGHSPLVTKGDTIEAYFEYVPYLRDGQRIPSGRKMGDDRTSGSIVYETLHNLRVAPNNSLTSLAWHSYFMNIADQISHAQKLYQSGEQTSGDPGGKYLHPSAKVKANFLRQVNKIVAAAQWADEAAKGTAPDSAQALKQDLDFDGEDEYILKSEKVFAVFENDGGRLEYAFAYDPLIGPVQLVAPFPQFALTGHTFYEDGEKTFHDSYPETAFEDISYAEGIKYSLLLYNAELGEGSITFTSPDNKFRKTFTLVGNIIRAHYEAAALGGNGLVVGFKLPVNLGKMFSENWWESLEKINTPEVIGWQCGTGGYAVINLTDAQMIDAYSFADSPVREEMKERGPEDDPYPVGHWLPFPINQVRVSGSGEFNFSLTLSAGIYTSVGQSDNGVSRQFGVCQNYPNPFNPKTVVEYQLPHAAEVEISIFNLQGQKVATLVQGHQTAGSHKITWDGKNESGHRIASGAYLYQMKAGDFVQVKKMLFLR